MNSKYFVPFETAKALKEKGYPQKWSDWYYYENIDKTFTLVSNQEVPQGLLNGRQSEFNFEYITAAPTYHEVVDWLEGKKKFIFAEYRGYATYDWVAFIRDENEKVVYLSAFPTREEALNAAILKALEMI